MRVILSSFDPSTGSRCSGCRKCRNKPLGGDREFLFVIACLPQAGERPKEAWQSQIPLYPPFLKGEKACQSGVCEQEIQEKI
ncbi:MAG: hypothetical protein A2149_02470 [Candidatus Schekmanbacteria bacterium RBG_16_38_11]|uniref:Uncharacterized protein n=1 Tax=Candidatus Schekmanbacteria bacterium RBG_16_38_11 TaxID=1817880 RepID=A0A1F7RS63_9BACT|nr:MAG: hypothetical protein A2149_02470 [Candidatus Schekmanbacteria bacterium RBG_16_38_11]